ncbi:MAG: ABC transporter ATP-binding protein/permease [Alphaproteobacteria bacterium]
MLSLIRRLWDLFDAKTRRQAVVLAGLIGIGGLLEGLGVGALFPLLKVLSDPEGIAGMPWLGRLYRAVGEPGHVVFVGGLCVAAMMAFLLKNIGAAVIARAQFRFVWSNRSRVASRLLRYYLFSPYTLHIQRNSSVLVRNISLSVQELFAGMVLPAVQLATEAAVVIVLVGLLVSVDPLSTLLAVVLIGAPAAATYMVIRRRLVGWGSEITTTNALVLRELAHSLGAVREIKVAGGEAVFALSFARIIARNSAVRERHQTVTAYPRLIVETLGVTVVLTWLLGLIASGRPPADMVATIGLFCIAAVRLMPSFSRIAGYAGNLRLGTATIDAIEADVRAAEALAATPVVAPSRLPFTRALRFENVRFRYPGREEDVLCGVDLTIPAGSSVAVVGASGAGKTTLVDMVLGLLEPAAGRILIDDQPMTGDTVRAWQERIGYIPQDVFLMDDTMAANIAFGKPLDPERLARAVRLAQLDQVVAGLPHGVDTGVGERGVALSGGQRQRVGIARALYHDADVLIMDEATSALDGETEARITGAIETLRGTRTIIIITHRLSTVKNCDTIFLMARGRVAGSGTFADLAAHDREFQGMVDRMRLASAAGDAP